MEPNTLIEPAATLPIEPMSWLDLMTIMFQARGVGLLSAIFLIAVMFVAIRVHCFFIGMSISEIVKSIREKNNHALAIYMGSLILAIALVIASGVKV